MNDNRQKNDHRGAVRIARNSAFVFATRVLYIGVALVSTALIARYLGVTDFGYFAFIMAISAFLEPLIDFGFERITTREIAGNKDLANKYLGSSIIARIFLSIIILSVIYLVTVIFNWDKKIIYAIYISTITQLLVSMGMLAVGTLRAFERMEYELWLRSIFNILYMILVIAVIRYDLGFLWIFGARLVANLLETIVLMAVTFRRFLMPVFEIDIKMLRYLLREAMPLGIFAVLLTASFKVDVFVLNYFKGPKDVSLFEAAHRIIIQLQTIPMAIAIAIFPHFARLAKDSKEALSASFYKTFKFMLIISLPLPIIMTASSHVVISVFFGDVFSDASSALNILSWTISFLFLIYIQTFIMTSVGRQTLNTISAAICFIVNLLLDVILVPRYGYIGASYATLISYILFFVISFYFVSKAVGMPPLGEILPKPLLSAGGMGIGYSLFLYYSKGGLIFVTAEIVILLLIYITMIYALKTLTPEESSIINSIFLKKRSARRELDVKQQ